MNTSRFLVNASCILQVRSIIFTNTYYGCRVNMCVIFVGFYDNVGSFPVSKTSHVPMYAHVMSRMYNSTIVLAEN